MGLAVVLGIGPEGPAVLPLLMAMARPVFVGESFIMFMADKSVTMTFRLLQ